MPAPRTRDAQQKRLPDQTTSSPLPAGAAALLALAGAGLPSEGVCRRAVHRAGIRALGAGSSCRCLRGLVRSCRSLDTLSTVLVVRDDFGGDVVEQLPSAEVVEQLPPSRCDALRGKAGVFVSELSPPLRRSPAGRMGVMKTADCSSASSEPRELNPISHASAVSCAAWPPLAAHGLWPVFGEYEPGTSTTIFACSPALATSLEAKATRPG